MIRLIQLHMVKCTCGKSGCLIFYGHYKRNVKFMSELIPLSIQRVRCRECGHTHALIPSNLVPYSQIPLTDHREIICCCSRNRPVDHILHRNYLIDESSVKYIFRQFRRHWEQRLRSIRVEPEDDNLVTQCFSFYSRQFMQIHRTRNILFHPPT